MSYVQSKTRLGLQFYRCDITLFIIHEFAFLEENCLYSKCMSETLMFAISSLNEYLFYLALTLLWRLNLKVAFGYKTCLCFDHLFRSHSWDINATILGKLQNSIFVRIFANCSFINRAASFYFGSCFRLSDVKFPKFRMLLVEFVKQIGNYQI